VKVFSPDALWLTLLVSRKTAGPTLL
jgi:hypothetical protein